MSGDKDADTASASAVGDFSFFAEEKPRVDQRAQGRKRDFAWGIENGDGDGDGDGDGGSKKVVGVENEARRRPKDVIEELKKFRRAQPRWSGKLEILRSRQG